MVPGEWPPASTWRFTGLSARLRTKWSGVESSRARQRPCGFPSHYDFQAGTDSVVPQVHLTVNGIIIAQLAVTVPELVDHFMNPTDGRKAEHLLTTALSAGPDIYWRHTTESHRPFPFFTPEITFLLEASGHSDAGCAKDGESVSNSSAKSRYAIR